MPPYYNKDNRRKGGGNPGNRQSELEENVVDVTALELKSYKSNPEQALQSLKLADTTGPPQRPAFGSKGDPVGLFSNHWTCSFNGSKPWYRYSVSVITEKEAEQPKGKKLVKIIDKLINQDLKSFTLVSDYSSIIISTENFAPEETKYNVSYKPEGAGPEVEPKVYRVLVQYNKTLHSDELIQYLSDTNLDIPEQPDKQDIIQAMNIIVANGFRRSDEVASDLRKHFPIRGVAVEKETLGPGLDVFRGYVFSVRAATGRLLLNAQVKHLAAYRATNLSGVPPATGRRPTYRLENLELMLNELWQAHYTWNDIEHFIKGVRVKLTHFTPYRNKRITGFAHPNDGPTIKPLHPVVVTHSPADPTQVKFWRDDKKGYTTVEKYFQDNYQKSSSKWPVINIGTRQDPKYVLASLCQICDGEPYRPKLDADQTGRMIKMAVRVPFENATSVAVKARAMIATHSESRMKSFGCNVGKSLVRVTGRKLHGPIVSYANKRAITVSDGSWNMYECKFVSVKTLPAWAILRITLEGKPGCSSDNFATSVKLFKAQLNKAGLNAGSSGVNNLILQQEADCLSRVKEKFKFYADNKSGPRLLLVVLPFVSVAIYNAVKSAGDIMFGIHTICVVENKFCSPGSIQTFANIALKFNLKLGGANQQLNDAEAYADLGFIAKGKTMLVGYDVTHPARGQDDAPSLAGMVASVNGRCAQWPAVVRIQPAKEEMVQTLKEMFKTRLQHWQKVNNNQLPDEILVYRDGVSEGQYKLVRETELPKMQEACRELYPPKDINQGLPRITIVIVGKRHNVRFYPADDKQQHNGNPPSGTIVDRGITETRIWDFYLQAHAAIKGTARPAHYVVLHDEIFRFRAAAQRQQKPTGRQPNTGTDLMIGQTAADDLERITHNLCYLYGRATKVVSVCPPAYYADIVCERARRWLSRLYTGGSGQGSPRAPSQAEVTVHPLLKDTMFYI